MYRVTLCAALQSVIRSVSTLHHVPYYVSAPLRAQPLVVSCTDVLGSLARAFSSALHYPCHQGEQVCLPVCQFAIALGDRTERFAQVSPEDLQRLERRIGSINSMAQIQHTQRADVPVEYVLGIEGFDSNRVDTEVRHLQ